MSLHAQTVTDAEAVRADFDQFLSENDFDNARKAIDVMGESYSELEALKMHQEYNRKITGCWREDGDVSEAILRANDDAE